MLLETYRDRSWGDQTYVFDPSAVGIRSQEPFEVQLGDTRRIIPAHIIVVAALLNDDPERSARLQHDCNVFALACETPSILSTILNTGFYDAGTTGVIPRTYMDIDPSTISSEDGPATSANQIVYLAESGEDNPADRTAHHFAVAATCSEGPRYYASKLGTGGPAVISSYADLMSRYPHARQGLASGFRMVYRPRPRRNP